MSLLSHHDQNRPSCDPQRTGRNATSSSSIILSVCKCLTKDPHCLEREIPELKYLYERIKYLEEEIDAPELVEDNDKIEAVFQN